MTKYLVQDISNILVDVASGQVRSFDETTSRIGVAVAEWVPLRDLTDFGGRFTERNPLNLPGPFYGAATDTCCMGPMEAPGNVLIDDAGLEFISRQPMDLAEIRNVVSAARAECFEGYGCDGDEHWTLPLIREWWSHRRVLIGAKVDEKNSVSDTIREWRQALNGAAEEYLREYAFFVEHRRLPRSNDVLPNLEQHRRRWFR